MIRDADAMTPRPPPPLPRDHLDVVVKLVRRTVRWAWLGAIVLLAGVALTLVVIKVRPKTYMSHTLLYYQEGFQWDFRNEGTRRVGQRLKETLLARSRLQQIVIDHGLFPKLVAAGKMDEALEEMHRRIIFRVNDGDTFTIAFVGDSPGDAHRVTATLAQNLIGDNARMRSEQIDLAKSFLDDQRKRSEDLLRQKEADLARFLARHPELAQAGGAGGMRGIAQAQPAPEPVRPPADAPSDGRAELVAAERQAHAQLVAARRDFADQSGRFTERHPAVVAAAARVQQAEAVHQRAAEALKASEPRRDPRPVSRAPARIGVEALEEHTRLTRELAEERDRFQKLDTRQFEATMAASSFLGGHSAQISIVDPAYVPERPAGTRTIMLLLAGIAASMALGLATAILGAVLDDRVDGRRDLERLDLAPFLGAVSGLWTKAARPAKRHRDAPARGGAAVGRHDGAAYPNLASLGQHAPRGALTAPPDASVPQLPAIGASHAAGAAQVTSIAVAASPPAMLAEVPDRGVRRMEAPPLTISTEPAGASAGAARDDPRLLLLRAPDSPAAASFRVIRHRLTERGNPRSILVTSPGVGEGKTTCALNLALALSETGRAKVLLLDANFRRPALAKIFGLQPPDGGRKAPELLASPLWTTFDPVTPWLDLSSLSPDSTTLLVDGLAMASRLAQLDAAGYDYIVIDAPPVLGAADVNLLEGSVSGVLLTMWSRRSRASKLREAIDQIGPRKVLGVVLMGS